MSIKFKCPVCGVEIECESKEIHYSGGRVATTIKLPPSRNDIGEMQVTCSNGHVINMALHSHYDNRYEKGYDENKYPGINIGSTIGYMYNEERKSAELGERERKVIKVVTLT